MLQTEVTKNVIAPSRQARKERFITYFSEPWRLCVFARDTVFSDLLFIPKFQISLARFSILDFRLFDHRITLSALAKTFGGIVSPICLAVFRLITNSNFVGCSTGRSVGFAPLRILSTY